MERRVIFDFDPDNLNVRPHPMGSNRTPGDQSAAADRNDQNIQVASIFEQLDRKRPLPGHDSHVIVRMDEDLSAAFRKFVGESGGFGQGIAVQNEFCTPESSTGNLSRWRVSRHDDGLVDAQ